LRDRIAFHSCHQPTRLAIRNVYFTAAQPPPLFMLFMAEHLRCEKHKEPQA
jgi:hypothetical protein